MSLKLLSELSPPELLRRPLMSGSMRMFAILLDKAHSAVLGLGTSNNLKQEKRAFAVSHRGLSLRHAPTHFNDILSQTSHCSSPYIAPSGQIHVIGATAHARLSFGVEPTPGKYFVTLCTVGLTREGLVS
jgi:hypothetical protein